MLTLGPNASHYLTTTAHCFGFSFRSLQLARLQELEEVLVEKDQSISELAEKLQVAGIERSDAEENWERQRTELKEEMERWGFLFFNCSNFLDSVGQGK